MLKFLSNTSSGTKSQVKTYGCRFLTEAVFTQSIRDEVLRFYVSNVSSPNTNVEQAIDAIAKNFYSSCEKKQTKANLSKISYGTFVTTSLSDKKETLRDLKIHVESERPIRLLR